MVRLEVHPAPVDTGLIFVRTDMPGEAEVIPALSRAVCATRRCTSLANAAGTRVDMSEHLLAALSAFGVDNARIALDGPELPTLDGCALEYGEKLLAAGLQRQSAPRRYLQVLKPVEEQKGDSHVRLEPGDGLHIHASIDYPGTLIGAQSHDFVLSAQAFMRDIAPARTFALASEVAAIRDAGLAKGGSEEDCLVVDGMKLAPGQTLRFANEFARHKVLDIVGDLALAGAPIAGRYTSAKGGHALNTKLVAALLADPAAWRIKTLV